MDADDRGPGFLVEHVLLRTVGKGRPPAQVVRWYGASGAPMTTDRHGRPVREAMSEEDYKAIEEHVPELAGMVLQELAAARAGRSARSSTS